jgi:spore germination cell wall hydrolase CwlJ-like protein
MHDRFHLVRELMLGWLVILFSYQVQASSLSRALATTVISDETNNRPRYLACLTEVIYREARGQSPAGQLAVGQVVLNRANDRRFPADVCEVIYQKDARRCQFSWVCYPRLPPPNPTEYASAARAAEQVLSNLPDLTKGAIYFRNTSAPDWPRLRRTAQIGNHIFYKDR